MPLVGRPNEAVICLFLVLGFSPFPCIPALSAPSSLSSRDPSHLSPHAASLSCYLSELLSQSFSFSLVGGDGLFKLDLEGSQLFGHGGNGSLGMERPLGLWEAGLRPDCQALRQAYGVNALRSSTCQSLCVEATGPWTIAFLLGFPSSDCGK